MKLFTLFLSLVLSSCTFSVNTVHTQGIAEDTVDGQQSVTPDVSPDISVPLIPG